jgi:hypothetical protein
LPGASSILACTSSTRSSSTFERRLRVDYASYFSVTDAIINRLLIGLLSSS